MSAYYCIYKAANQSNEICIRASTNTTITSQIHKVHKNTQKTFLYVLQCQWLNQMTKDKALNNTS